MKIFGWISTLLGGGGLIGTLIAKDSLAYRIDSLAGYIGFEKGFRSTVDLLFYVSVLLLVLGVVLLVVGYTKNTAKHPNIVQNSYVSSPSNPFPQNGADVKQESICPYCKVPIAVKNQFCVHCGNRVR